MDTKGTIITDLKLDPLKQHTYNKQSVEVAKVESNLSRNDLPVIITHTKAVRISPEA